MILKYLKKSIRITQLRHLTMSLTKIIVICSDGMEKQPLAIVGSPYWMAPEVLRGEPYDEKVNVLNIYPLYNLFEVLYNCFIQGNN